MNKKTYLLLLLAFFVTACAEPISKEGKRTLRKDFQCATAKEDIRILEKERASNLKRLAAGVRSILPVAAVVGILKGTWKDRTKVAAGDYNKAIDRRIREIKAVCGPKMR